jgi:Big-like domain-containing protein/putative Ig domain-containing protein
MRLRGYRMPARRTACTAVALALGAGALFGLASPAVAAPGTVPSAAQGDTSVSGNANPTSFQHGSAATTLTVSGLPADATGAVAFTDDVKGRTLCTTTAEVGSCSVDSLLPVGSYSVSVSYAGDGNYNPSGNAGVASFDVTTAYFEPYASISPGTSAYGDTITFTDVNYIPADATGTIEFEAFGVDGTLSLAYFCSTDVQSRSCTMNNVPVAAYSDVRIYYSGDSNYGFYGAFGDNFTVTKADTAVTVNDTVGHPNQATTVTPLGLGGASGTVTFTDATTGAQLCQSAPNGTCDIAVLPLGTYSVNADYSGDGNYNPSTTTFTLTVVKAPATMTVTMPDPSVTYGTAESLDVNGLPTDAIGTVDFVDQNGTALCSVDLADGGPCLTSATLTVGGYQVTATYSGDGNYDTGTATGSFTVTKAAVAITASVGDNSVYYGTAASLDVRGLPADAAGRVDFVDAKGTALCSVDLADGGPCATSATLPGGTYQVTATYSGDDNYQTATASTSFTVYQAPTITSTDHTTFAVGTAGTFTFAAAPGTPSTMTLGVAGTVPPGLHFTDIGDGTATLTGTPGVGEGGSYPLTITATNGVPTTPTQAFTLTVTELPGFISTNATWFTVGTASSFTVSSVAGYPVATVLTQAGALPAGVSWLDNADGTATISGTPTAGTGGSYPLTLTATNSVGHRDQAFTLAVYESTTITSANIATFTAGAPDTFTVTTAGGYPTPPTIGLIGTLPDGLSFVDNRDGTGTLTGTVTAGGSYPLAVTAGNAASADTSQAFTLTVDGPPSFTSDAAATFTAGAAGIVLVTTRPGVPASTVLTETGALPTGVTFTVVGDGTAVLVGTAPPSAIGTYPLTLSASNGAGDDTEQAFTLTISPAVRVTLPALRPASDGALHGVGPVTVVGTVLHVSGSGYAAGAPVTIGRYSTPTLLTTVTATDAGTFTATIRLTAALGGHVVVAGGLGADGAVRYLEAETLVVAVPLTQTGPAATAAANGVGTNAAGLANTGPDGNILASISWSLALLLAGLMLVIAARRPDPARG